MPRRCARRGASRRAPRLGLSAQSRWQGGAAPLVSAAIHTARRSAPEPARSTVREACGRDGSTGSRTLRGRAQALPFSLRFARAFTGLPRARRAAYVSPAQVLPRLATALRADLQRARRRDRDARWCSWAIHGVREWVLSPELDNELLLAVRLRAGALRVLDPRAWCLSGRACGGCLDLRHLCVAARKLDAPDRQCGLAARLRHAGRAPLRRRALPAVLRRDGGRRRARASCGLRRDARSDDRRVGGDLGLHGGRDPLCVPARRPAAPDRQQSGRGLSGAGAAAARGAARSARADLPRASGSA